MQQLFTDSAFYPAAFLSVTEVFLTFFTADTGIMFIRITQVGIVNHFLEIILHTSASYFLWKIGELRSKNFSTETQLYLDGPEFDNFGGRDNSMRSFVGICSGKPGWMLMDGCMSEDAAL